jgi:hypothetical protein
LLVRLLLRVAPAPTPKEAERRAKAATELFLAVHAAASGKPATSAIRE